MKTYISNTIKYIVGLYNRIPSTTKRHIISALQTFIATFFSVIAIQVQAGNPEIFLTTAGIISIVVAAARAGVKAVYELAILPLLKS